MKCGCKNKSCKCSKCFPDHAGCEEIKSPYIIKVCKKDKPPVLHPFSVKKLNCQPTTEEDGIDLVVYDWGSGEAGTIFFIPGLGETNEIFLYQMENLATRGFRVIAYDPRRQGKSDKPYVPEDFGISPQMDVWADDVRAILECLDLQNVTLVGHSIGAGVVVRYMARHCCARICKAIPISILAPSPAQFPPFPTRAQFLAAIRNDFPGTIFTTFNLLFFGTPQTPATIDFFWQLAMETPIMAYISTFRIYGPGPTSLDDAPKACVPTLYIHGQNDFLAPASNSVLMQSITPNSQILLLTPAGHGVMIDQKQQVNDAIANFACPASPC